MITCTACGFQNLNNDAFCGSCGGFLEWTGETAAPAAPEESEDDLLPKRSLLSRVQTVLSLDVHAPGENEQSGETTASGPPGKPPSGGPPKKPSSGPPKPPSGGPPKKPSSGPPKKPKDAAALVAEGATSSTPSSEAPSPNPPSPKRIAKKVVAPGERVVGASKNEPQPGTVAPGVTNPVKPQRPVQQQRPATQSPTRKLLPGDLICGDCGEGNPPGRKFCSRCGATLADAETAKARWWRRWIPRRRRRSLVAGERPWKSKDGKQKRPGGGIADTLKKVFAKVRPIIAVALLLGGLIYGVSPDLRGRANDRIGTVKDELLSKIRKNYAPVSPIEVTATSAMEGSVPSLVFDSNTLTSWLAPGSDPEPTLIVRFDEPIDLQRIKLWNGSAENLKDFARVSDIHFVFDTGQSFDLNVLDVPTPEEYEIKNAQGVREIELHIVGTYSSLAGTDLGLSEIEFLILR